MEVIMDDNRLKVLFTSLKCCSCQHYMTEVYKACGDYYCQSCVEKRMPYEPLRFQNVKADLHMSRMCQNFKQFANPDCKEPNGNANKLVQAAVLKIQKQRKKVEEMQVSFQSLSNRLKMTEPQKFFSRLIIYYLEMENMAPTLTRCLEAGVVVTEFSEELLTVRKNNVQLKDKLEVIVIPKPGYHTNLEYYKRVYAQFNIPTLDIEYFTLILKYNQLTVMNYFLIVPENVSDLNSHGFPYSTLTHDLYDLQQL